MRMTLIHRELWDYVEETKKRTFREEAERLAKDGRALATIELGVATTELTPLKRCETSTEAWKRLEKIYSPGAASRKVTIVRRLKKLKELYDRTMSEHVDNLTDVVGKFNEIRS